MTTVRPLRDSDRSAVAHVARSCGQSGPVSAADDRYLAHVAACGRLSVSEQGGAVVAFGGTVGLRGASFLTDLFVLPESRDAGHGTALVDDLWGGTSARVTSSSQDPRALAAYARLGATPRWPLLYLQVAGARVSPQVPVVHGEVDDRDPEWALALDATSSVRVLAGPDRAATTAVVRRDGDTWTVLRATSPDPRGLAVLVADLRSRARSEGVVNLVVPGPHPGLADLMTAGARVVGVDLWCATDGAADLVDPVRELPSPGLG